MIKEWLGVIKTGEINTGAVKYFKTKWLSDLPAVLWPES